jgi:urea carboxylase
MKLRDIFTKSSLMVVAVGFFVALPIALPIDPRQRIQCPKMNPSRVHTPEGQVGWGGSCMALYNVESPGGYMNAGLSIPGADILGFKNGYNSEKPWLFEDFDQITFYEVNEDEYESMMATFRSGRYKYEYEDAEFDMKEHNQLLRDTKEEVETIRAKQREAQAEMDKREKELLDKWSKEKEAGKISMDTVEELMHDPGIIAVEAPLNANVWKVEVKEGETVKLEQVVSILEAMKLEIPVKTEEEMEGATVEKLLVKPNDVVQAGAPLMLLRKHKGKE